MAQVISLPFWISIIKTNDSTNFLVIGYGNSLRSDDGVGLHICVQEDKPVVRRHAKFAQRLVHGRNFLRDDRWIGNSSDCRETKAKVGRTSGSTSRAWTRFMNVRLVCK